MHSRPLSIEYVMYAYGLYPFSLATKYMHFATIFYHLVAVTIFSVWSPAFRDIISDKTSTEIEWNLYEQELTGIVKW